MTDAARTPTPAPAAADPPPPAPKRRMMDDPVVKWMVFVAVGLVILFLATVVGVLVTGVTTPTGPRSLAEKEVLMAATAVQGQSRRRPGALRGRTHRHR